MVYAAEVWDGTTYIPLASGSPGARTFARIGTGTTDPNVLTNATFDTNISGWVKETNAGLAWVSPGAARLTPGTSTDPYFYQAPAGVTAAAGNRWRGKCRVRGDGLVGVHTQTSGGATDWGTYVYFNSGASWVEVEFASPVATATYNKPWLLFGVTNSAGKYVEVDWVGIWEENVTPVPRAVGDMLIIPGDPAMSWDTDWRYPTLINGWQNYDTSYWNAAKYRKMAGNVVAITGLIRSGTIGWTAFYLPPGYRPTAGILLCNAQSADTSSRIDIRTDGAVTTTAGNPAWCSIELNFYAG